MSSTRLCLLLGVGIASSLLGGCGSPSPLHVGVALSGDGAAAARIAADEINATGGIGGRPLRLVVLPDSSGSAEAALEAAEALASDSRILAVLGHANSAASLAAAQVYNDRGLPHVAPTTTSPLFRRSGPYSFRLVPDDTRQAEFLARQVAPGTRVAVAFVNDDYGRMLHTELVERLEAHGVSIVYEGAYSERGEDPGDQLVRSIVAADPDLLIWLGRSLHFAHVRVHPALQAWRGRVLGSDAMENAVVYANRQGEFTGIRFVRFIDPADTARAVQLLRTRYVAYTEGMELTTQALLAYDGVHLLAAALRSGARDRGAVRRYLASVGRELPPLQGVGGSIAFDAEGDATRPYLLAEVTSHGVRSLPGR